MAIVTRLREIRETQMNLLGIKSQTAWMLLYSEKTGQTKNKTTLWYWEKPESDPQYRTAEIRYLKFLCTEFNYNPAYVLDLVEEPEFTDSYKADDFPELNRIIESVNEHPPLAIAFRSLLANKDMELLRDLHLQMFGKHPTLYDEFKDLVDLLEKHPELFKAHPGTKIA